MAGMTIPEFVAALNTEMTAHITFSIVDTTVWSVRDPKDGPIGNRTISVTRREGNENTTLGTLSLDYDADLVERAFIYKGVPFSLVPKVLRDIAI